ncbi:MAG: hypothetical protein ACFFDK_15140 [Promethearchaeota archaeon]
MFEIKFPKKFLRRLIIVELLFGLGLITLGSFLLIDLYIYVYINHGYYKYTVFGIIFDVLLAITGLLKVISYLLMKKSYHQGLNASMLSLLFLASNFLYLCVFIFVFGLINVLPPAPTGAGLVIYSAQFVLSSMVFLILVYFFLLILINKENLKKSLK